MSRNLRLILMSVGLVAFAVVIYFVVLSPIRADIKNTNSAIADQQQKLQDANAKLGQADTVKAEGKRNEARLLELAKMIPPTPELPSLLLQIQDLANQSGIDFISIAPGDVQSAAGSQYETMPLDLTFSGTFFDLSDFVYRAEQMVAGPGRLLAIKTIGLTVSNGTTGGVTASTSPKLDVHVSLLAYILPAAGSAGSTTGAAAAGTTTSTTASPAKK